VGLFSPNVYYVFRPKEAQKMKPYVTGGYTRAFGHDSGVNMGNFGGGMTYWAKQKMGFLAEFRDHIGSKNSVRAQLWTVRFGLAFR
jgi:hypothetical protein